MSATQHHGLAPRDYAIALAMNLFWGLNIIAVKMAMEATQPLTAACVRLWIVFIVCWPFLRIVRGSTGKLMLLGLLNGALFFGLINLSVKVTDNLPALAIAGQLGAPMSLILAVIFLKETIAWPRIVGIAVTFLGVVFLVFDPHVVDEVPGLALISASSLVWAVASLIQRGLDGVSVLNMFAWIGLIGASILTPTAMLLEPAAFAALPDMRLGDLGWIAFSAVCSSVLGHGGMAWLLQRHPVSMVAPLTLLAPVVSVVVASLVYGTILTPVMIVGGLICMSGVAIITIRSGKKMEAAG